MPVDPDPEWAKNNIEQRPEKKVKSGRQVKQTATAENRSREKEERTAGENSDDDSVSGGETGSGKKLANASKESVSPVASFTSPTNSSSGSGMEEKMREHTANDAPPMKTTIAMDDEERRMAWKEKTFVPRESCDWRLFLQKLLAFGEKGEPQKLRKAIEKEDIGCLLIEAKKTFMSQPVLLELDPPLYVCGDTHGQFFDTLRIFDTFGFPPTASYLFLGDYVDRGWHSLENILLLFSYKVLYPNNFFLVRGNHEGISQNRRNGFRNSVMGAYKSVQLFMLFQETFNTMPPTALIGGRILCMHGGLSQYMESRALLRSIQRPMLDAEGYVDEWLEDGNTHALMAYGILWNDPLRVVDGWEDNHCRGIGAYVFGKKGFDDVAKKLGIDMVFRAHNPAPDGYEFFFDRRLMTIFSAPTYAYRHNNYGAVMLVDADMQCSLTLLRHSNQKEQPEMVPVEFGKPDFEKRKPKEIEESAGKEETKVERKTDTPL